MFKKIILLTTRISEYDVERFGLNFFLSKGFNCEIINIKKLITNDEYNVENNYKNKKIIISIPHTKNEFFEIINKLNKDNTILINTL